MLRLIEHYISPQGEGPKVGIMSQFVRFAGCNLKCPGWPCDTQHAIDPKIFEREQDLVSSEELIEKILAMSEAYGADNIVLTGGEPLLQNQSDLSFIAHALSRAVQFEVFTNGARSVFPALVDCCSFVMDWKLPGSGEDPYNKQRLGNIQALDHSKNSVKFVITTQGDLNVALSLYNEHLKGRSIQVFVGAAWDRFSNERIVEFVKMHRLPWRLNVQVQNYIFGSQRRYT